MWKEFEISGINCSKTAAPVVSAVMSGLIEIMKAAEVSHKQ